MATLDEELITTDISDEEAATGFIETLLLLVTLLKMKSGDKCIN